MQLNQNPNSVSYLQMSIIIVHLRIVYLIEYLEPILWLSPRHGQGSETDPRIGQL